jgi:hypothetical protein
VNEKIEEILKNSHTKELDMKLLERHLPDKMRLTRFDVINVVKEMEKEGVLFRKIKERGV